jgi:hypothetical protein
MDCKEIGCEDVDWFNMAQDEVQWPALKNIVISLWGHLGWIRFLPDLVISQTYEGGR